MKSNDSGAWLAVLCFIGLPLLALGVIAFCSYHLAITTGHSPLLFVPFGTVGGAIFLGATITSSGSDMMDFAVSSIIVIVLTIIMLPVFIRARENAHKRAIKQALREHGAIYPQAIKKGVQPSR
ncbi:hypothetical protein EON83_18715 [bacterium]|nr:MAG: hypothetical protein EON83_18715 [bacterium]